MLTIKIIGKLRGLIRLLKTRAIKSQTRELEIAAERVDISTELAEARLQFSRELQETLEKRALTRLSKDLSRINKSKLIAGNNLLELEAS